MDTIDNAPAELAESVREFFPPEEWDHAVSIARLESGWSAFALADSRDSEHGCGDVVAIKNGVRITAELSVGWFQINACNFKGWNPWHLYNTRHNVGTAHLLWQQAGGSWSPWYYSATTLGLL